MTWREKYTRFALGVEETAYGVTASSFQVVDMDADLPGDLAQRVQDINLRATQFGGGVRPVLGGKDTGATVTFRWVADGFTASYDPTSAVPGTTAGVVGITSVLMGWALGSNASAAATHANLWKGAHLSAAGYDAADVGAGTTDTTITTVAGAYTPGQLVVAGASLTDYQVGWISTIAGAPEVLTLQRASKNTAAIGEDTFPTVVAYVSNEERVSQTLRFTGEADEYCFDLLGLKPASGSIDWSSGQVPVCELVCEYTGWEFDDSGALGGLSEPTAFTQLPDVSGSNEGRIIINGTAAALADFRMEFECTPHQEQNHSAAEGISRRVMDFSPTVTFAQRRDTTHAVSGGEDIWRQRFTDGTPIDVQLEVGDTPGAGISMLCPQWIVAEPVVPEWIDGVLYNRVTIKPWRYSADTGDTAPADTTLRIGWW